ERVGRHSDQYLEPAILRLEEDRHSHEIGDVVGGDRHGARQPCRENREADAPHMVDLPPGGATAPVSPRRLDFSHSFRSQSAPPRRTRAASARRTIAAAPVSNTTPKGIFASWLHRSVSQPQAVSAASADTMMRSMRSVRAREKREKR